jgi:hypothetical protein
MHNLYREFISAMAGGVPRWWHLPLQWHRATGLVGWALPAMAARRLSSAVAGGPQRPVPRVRCIRLKTQPSGAVRPAGIGIALSGRTDRPEGWKVVRPHWSDSNGSVGAVWEADAREAPCHRRHARAPEGEVSRPKGHDTQAVSGVCRCAVNRCEPGIPPGMPGKTPEGGQRMATVKGFLVAASCGLVLLGAVAVQALSFGDDRQFGGPICLESPEVRVSRPCPPPEGD